MFGNLSSNIFKGETIERPNVTDISVRMSVNSNLKINVTPDSRGKVEQQCHSATFNNVTYEKAKSSSSNKSQISKKFTRTLSMEKSKEEKMNRKLSNLELYTSFYQRALYYKKKLKINYQIQQNTNLKEMIVKLYQMGFSDEKIERAFHYADSSSIEEVMYFLVPNSNGLWEHKFIPESQTFPGKECFLCRRNKKYKETNNPSKI